MIATPALSQYKFIIAHVINNSIYRVHNYITIDKGSNSGIKPEMGVVDQNGVAGHLVGPYDLKTEIRGIPIGFDIIHVVGIQRTAQVFIHKRGKGIHIFLKLFLKGGGVNIGFGKRFHSKLIFHAKQIQGTS